MVHVLQRRLSAVGQPSLLGLADAQLTIVVPNDVARSTHSSRVRVAAIRMSNVSIDTIPIHVRVVVPAIKSSAAVNVAPKETAVVAIGVVQKETSVVGRRVVQTDTSVETVGPVTGSS